STSGALLGVYPTFGTSPFGVAFDGANIWVTNFDSNNVTKLSTSGFPLGSYPTGSNPWGVAFDGTNIWVANSGGSVTKLSTSGTVLGTYSVPGGSIYPSYNVAFDGTNIWITNWGNNTVVKLSTTGVL